MIENCKSIFLTLLSLLFLLPGNVKSQVTGGSVKCVCIDAGHGGIDPGAIGSRSKEKNVVLKIALQVGSKIKKAYPDVNVIYTRKTDVFVELKDRTAFAKRNKADLFISIHANATKNKTAKGIETFVLGTNSSQQVLRVAMDENSVIRYEKDYSIKYEHFNPNSVDSYIIFNLIKNSHLERSLKLASLIQKELISTTHRDDRDVKQAPLWVLKDVSMPSTLVEVGFISNPSDETYINSPLGIDKISSSICSAFGKYKESIESKPKMLASVSTNKEKINDSKTEKKNDKYNSWDLLYIVQIASTPIKETNIKRFGLKEDVNYIFSQGRYRYYVGGTTQYAEAVELLKNVRQTIAGAFICVLRNGNITTLSEAKNM